MKWIVSEGGPLILLPKKALFSWSGYDGDDYERVCGEEDYIGLLSVNGRQALVLGDEPCQTAIFMSGWDSLILVRWQWAEDEESVFKHLKSITPQSFENGDVLDYLTTGGEFLLFDAALPGHEAEGFDFNLAKGKYCIKTICYEPDAETALILHAFIQN
ncbi:hypothetical protein H0A36_27685 [Endozoicomonas sp. SM1973]|uniref:Uncharacterized protein n=1 Tax=Spartinivicinus marinus TaxID=2994442 RepID=A0A853IH02_9GAMM|nr:hypothetical protein [Spartinivicinus marinus]